MSGLNLQTGMTGSVVGGLYGGQSSVSPTRTAVPEGPTSIASMAYGGGAGMDGTSSVGMHSVGVGMIALALLVCMWWALPR